LTAAQIDSQLSGQMNLFEGGQGKLIELPRKVGPFEHALMLHERDDPAASECYYKAIQAGDYVADAYCNLGILAFESGALPKAADCFTLSLKDDPRHFESHFNLGNLYLDAGDLRLARLHYEIAVEIEPSFSNLHFNLGLVYLQDNDIDLAIDAFRRCLELTDEGEDKTQVERLLHRIEQLANRRR
ncbi:MAG: tetratricopeptide repeat protein, partial [Blastocatellia bacterium]